MTITIQPDLLTDEHFPVDFGRYVLLGVLGEGGMARVFRAELQGQQGFRKPTAIKVIHAAIAARGEALRQSLINEARTGGLLHHPNIVDTYDFGEVSGLPYIAMELVRGVGLDRVLAERGALEPSLALEVGAQICAGLEHAHDLEVDGVSAGLVHRDLKPSNIILSRDGLTKVMDFGIAKATTNAYSTTQTGTTKGTPAYMSPEQASGHDLDRRSDVFAVGALLYEMATGQRFFQGDTLMALLMAVVHVEAMIADEERMDPVDAAVPGLADVVRRCLRQDAAQRWATAGDVEAALKQLARGVPVGTPLRRFARSFGAGSSDTTATLSGGSEASWGTVGAPPGQSTPAGSPSSTPAGSPLAAASAAVSSAVPPTVAQTAVPPTRLQLPSEPRSPAAPPGVAPTLWQAPSEDDEGLPWGPLVAGFGLTMLVAGLLFFWLREPTPTPPTEVLPPLAREPRPVDSTDEVTDEGEVIDGDEVEVAARDEDPEPEPSEPMADPSGSAPPPEPSPQPAGESVPPGTAAAVTARPEPQAAPRPVAAPASGRFGIESAEAEEAEQLRDGAVVRFSVVLTGSTPDDEVFVHFNPPKARWLRRQMRYAGRGRWVLNVTFPRKAVGKTYWYVVAKPADGSAAERWGSEVSPKKLRLRWD